MKKLLWASALMTLFVAAPSHAGTQYEYGVCASYSDGSGYCGGTFLGFRNYSDPTTYAGFHTSSSGTNAFLSNWNGSAHTCLASSAVVGLWPQLQTARGYFYVHWNASGICDSVAFTNGSSYANF